MMITGFLKNNRSDLIMVAFFALICFALFFLNLNPKVELQKGEKAKARVIAVDNTFVRTQGMLTTGFQIMKLEILSGTHSGEIFTAQNQLLSQMDLDKIFCDGDIVLAAIRAGASAGADVITAQDHYRISYTFWLFALFASLLLLFGGITGFKALLSFLFSCMVIWKLVIPLCLLGKNPIAVSFATVTLLTAAIIFIVAGLNRKGTTAFIGSMAGVAASCILAIVFTALFKINGATMPYSQALIYSGYGFLNLSQIYIGAIFLASSGAVMDLSMDVAAGMDEVAKANHSLSRRELIHSGMRIGRSVVGTMTTTLLLAYSGGYLTLMMSFAAQGVQPVDFINNPYVAAEMVKTIIGSFGLVLVAPFTALVGGFVIGHKRPKP